MYKGNSYVLMRLCIYTYMCINVYIHIFMYVDVRIHLHVCIHVFVYMFVYMCLYICVCIYVCIYEFVYRYMYVFMYESTRVPRWWGCARARWLHVKQADVSFLVARAAQVSLRLACRLNLLAQNVCQHINFLHWVSIFCFLSSKINILHILTNSIITELISIWFNASKPASCSYNWLLYIQN